MPSGPMQKRNIGDDGDEHNDEPILLRILIIMAIAVATGSKCSKIDMMMALDAHGEKFELP